MDVMRTLGVMAASALWATAVTLMIVASVADQARWQLASWSLLTTGVAMVVTFWQLLERNRSKLMDYLAHQDLRMAAAVSVALRSNDEQRPTPIR